MPKQRPPSKNQTQNCSFCGEHKDRVPLIVTSHLKPDCACCSTCALAVVQQVQVWAYGIFREAMKVTKAAPKLVVPASNKQAVDAAIKKAGDGGA